MIYLVTFFVAVPVALAFRSLALLETGDHVAIELVGLSSLLSYVAGVFALILAGSIIRRRSISSALASIPNAFGPKTIVLDTEAVSISGTLSEVRWTWPAITQLSATKGLLCLWIGSQTAVIIPDRVFATEEVRKSAIAFIEGKFAAAKAPA